MEGRIVVSFSKVKVDDWLKFKSLVARNGTTITKVLWKAAQEYMEKEGREE